MHKGDKHELVSESEHCLTVSFVHVRGKVLTVKNLWRYVHSFRHNVGIGQTDIRKDFTVTISCFACMACWRAIKSRFQAYRYKTIML